MLNSTRVALQSWIVVGVVLVAALAVDAYQMRRAPSSRDDRETLVLSVMGRRRQVPSPTAFAPAERQASGGDSSVRRVAAVIGEAELDLRNVVLRSGDAVVVSATAVMGAVVIRVPDDWVVDARAVPMLGSLSDRRLRPFDALTVEPRREGPAPRLIIRGAVVMGELVVKS